MQCVRPILTKKAGYVPCGKCPNCLANLRQEWIFRLRSEFLSSKFGLFVTMTYDDEHYPKTGTCKRDVQLFLKRLRKALGNRSFRYYIVSEYGDHTYRGHYHGLFFFQNNFSGSINDTLYDQFVNCWGNGFMKFGEIEEGSIVYCTKYCLKESPTPPQYLKPFRLVSRCPGIGDYYVQKYADYHHDTLNMKFVSLPGSSAPMPRFFKSKIYQKFETYEVIKLEAQKETNIVDKHFKKYRSFLRLKGLEDTDESRLLFEKHLEGVRSRHAELVRKHTKKQTL